MYNFGGHRLLKIWEGKNVQNLAHFTTTFDFDFDFDSGTDRDIDKR